jgi:hypothetical protein
MSFQMLPREVMKIIGDMSNSTYFCLFYWPCIKNHGKVLMVCNNLNDCVNTLLTYIGTKEDTDRRNIYDTNNKEWKYNWQNGIAIEDLHIEEIQFNTDIYQGHYSYKYVLLQETRNIINRTLVKYWGRPVINDRPYDELEVILASIKIDTNFNWTPTEQFKQFDWNIFKQDVHNIT